MTVNSQGKYVVCLEYIAGDGTKRVMRAKPTTRKAARAKKRQFDGLRKGERCWIESSPKKKQDWRKKLEGSEKDDSHISG